MADSTNVKVIMKFIDEDEKAFQTTVNYAKSDVTDASVKNLMDVMISKAEIFLRPPYQKTGAVKVVTAETDMNVQD